jgi:hypothetical protein
MMKKSLVTCACIIFHFPGVGGMHAVARILHNVNANFNLICRGVKQVGYFVQNVILYSVLIMTRC